MEQVITNTTDTVQSVQQKKIAFKLDQIVWYFIGAIDVLLLLRLVLRILGASVASDFTSFIYSVTEIFVIPFRGILGNPVYGNNQFEWATLIAIVVISLIGVGISQLVRIASPVTETDLASSSS